MSSKGTGLCMPTHFTDPVSVSAVLCKPLSQEAASREAKSLPKSPLAFSSRYTNADSSILMLKPPIQPILRWIQAVKCLFHRARPPALGSGGGRGLRSFACPPDRLRILFHRFLGGC